MTMTVFVLWLNDKRGVEKMSNKVITIGNIMEHYENPIAELINAACKFDSTIIFESDTKKINAKSIMGMMALPMKAGMEIKIVTEGKDEELALTSMESFLHCN